MAKRSPDESSFKLKRRCYTRVKRRCRDKNRYFDLTLEQFIEICERNCALCGAEPARKLWQGYTEPWFANGIDRIDSSKGYFIGNVQPCCAECNRMKSDMTEEQFATRIKEINDHLERRED